MKKYFIPLIITYLILCLSTNSKAQTQPQDTVKRISLQDIRDFNSWASKNIAYEDYVNMKVEQTLQQLWLYIERKRTQSIEKQIPKK